MTAFRPFFTAAAIAIGVIAPTDTAAAQTKGGEAAAILQQIMEDQPEQFFWQSDVISKDEVQSELAQLYVTLEANGVLETRGVTIEKGETPTDIMIRAGAWPHWLEYRMPLNVDAMLCKLNPEICVPAKSADTGSDWARAWPGMEIRVPAVTLELDYKFGVRNEETIARRTRQIDLVETADLSDLWCRQSGQQHAICLDNATERGWLDEEPAIYQFVYDGRSDLDRFEAIVDPAALKEFGAPDSTSRIVALPTVGATVETRQQPTGGVTRFLHTLNEKVIVNPKFSIETSLSQHNRKLLGRMGFLDHDQYRHPYSAQLGPKPIRIAHIDTEAELTHCLFPADVVFKRWNFEEQILERVDHPQIAHNGHPTPDTGGIAGDNADMAGPPCGGMNPGALPQKSHGTHTLGLLIDALTQGGTIQMPPHGDDPPVTVYHIPIGQEQPNQIAIKRFIEVLEMLPTWRIDVVSMSLSWNRADTRLMEEVISNQKDSIFYVVAAGNQGESEGCSKSPACIESKNVISVVALDADDEGHLALMPDTNRGASHHDIGAIGANLVSSVNDGMLGTFSGTSQATPLVASSIGYLIQRGQSGIDNIYERLMTTAYLDSALLGASKATMINVQRALETDTDFLDLKNGCRMRGEFDRLTDNRDVHADSLAGGAIDISARDIRRLYYNERDDWYLIMHLNGGNFISAGYLFDDDQLERDIRFRPTGIDPDSAESCGDVTEGNMAHFRLGDVKDLVLTSR